jgi:hypothetical protein
VRRSLSCWTPHPALPELIDYPARIDSEHEAQLLGDSDRVLLHALIDRIQPDRVAAHRDPLQSNPLIDGEQCALIDWEHCGRYLSGYDHALLHIVGAAASPTLAAAIAKRVTAAAIRLPFLVNSILLACREIRIHTSLPPGATPAHRLPTLRDLHARLLRQMHQETR